MSRWRQPRFLRLIAALALTGALFAACSGSGDDGEIAEPDDPTDLIVEWPAVCDEAFALAESGIGAGADSSAVAQGVADAAAPLFVECTAAVVADYPPSCLEVVTTMSGMLEASVQDPESVVGVGADLIMRRSDALITCDIDHVYDVADD